MTITTKCARCGKDMEFTMPASDDPQLDQTLAKFANMAWCDACASLTKPRKPQPKPQTESRLPYAD